MNRAVSSALATGSKPEHENQTLVHSFSFNALVDVAREQDQRLECNSFAELEATVIQIRQREQEATRVLDYADTNLKDQYPPHVFNLVKEMIREAFERQPVGTTSLEGEVRTFARQQRRGCNDLYAQLDQ